MSLPASVPVLSCAAAKAWEAGRLKNEAAEWDAMQQAGSALAAAISEDWREIGGWPQRARLLVLAGKGHNGGDAMLAAQALLADRPAAVDLLLCYAENSLRPMARRALEDLRRSAGPQLQVVSLAGLKAELASYDVCLDGVFGFQYRPPLEQPIAELLAWVNTHPRIRLRAAVDLPSGLGEESADTVFRADFTYATGIVKAPVVAPAHAAYVGRLRYLDLGFFDPVAGVGDPGPGLASPAADHILLPSILTSLAQLRPSLSDKRAFGHLLVVGGSHSYPGAVVLAVRAALRSGVGLVTAFVPEKLVAEYAASHPEVMWVGCPENSAGGLNLGTLAFVRERLARASAMLIGPGLGADAETLGLIQAIVRNTNIPLVLDADALRPEVIAAVGHKPFVATPHAGEYQRIAPAMSGAPNGVLVLKGPLTRIVGRALCPTDSRDDGHNARPTNYYSPFGGPVLARGGSGDMLAGLVGGLLAQQPDDPLLAACRGVVWHGRAADLLARSRGQVAVETSQLLEQLGPALTS
jgi:ADP-dependent NAD(P)H-hydrate dehydratase / NAD(P)H-hydrate epimerase